jgi:hypothetical protein
VWPSAALVAMSAALLVLVLGIAAAVTYDDGASDRVEGQVPLSTSTPPSTATSTSRTSSSTTTTTTAAPSTSTSTTVRGIPGTTVTVRASVPSPEAAANGLIAAYRNDDRTQARRFASDPVVDVLFEQPYVPADDPGFQGCDPQGGDFLCTYLQPDIRYELTAHRSDAGEFRIVDIDVHET